MTPEIVVGLIGAGGALGGALLGGLATFSGMVYQQRRQAEHATEERRAEMAHQAINTIIDQTWILGKLVPEWSFEKFEWTPEMDACVESIRMAALRLPQTDLREPVEAACAYNFGADQALSSRFVDRPAVRVRMMAEQVRRRLGSFLRGEPLGPVDGALRQALDTQEHFYQLLQSSAPR